MTHLPASIAAAIVAALAIGPAFAGAVPIGAGAYSPVSVGTTDGVILPAGAASNYLELWNLSATTSVCINFGVPATISGAATCAAIRNTIAGLKP